MTDLKYQFDSIASIYDEIRPKPPLESMNVVKEFANLSKNSRVLEVGVGTGQATESLVDVACEVVGLELGADLAKIAQQKFASNPKINILNTSFEDWQPQPASFELFLCVQAFHWIDTDWGLNAISKNLKPGGSLAIIWHLDRSGESEFNKSSQPIYNRFNHLMTLKDNLKEKQSPNNWSKVFELLRTNPNFESFKLHQFTWEQLYSKNEYLKLLQTYSNHSLLQGQDKIEFYNAISNVIDNFGGSISRTRETITLLANKSSN